MIRTVSEGYSKPDALPPITINEGGVLEWLITRGKVKSTWHRDMKGVQESLAEAVGSLRSLLPPGHAALGILDAHAEDIQAVGTSAEHSEKSVYFDVVVPVMAELLKTESQRTTLFRQYASPSLRAWDTLARFYAKENLHLAELGNEMLAAIKYELPSMHRALTAAAKECGEINGRAARAADTAKKHLGAYHRMCGEWGISPLGLGTARAQLEGLCGTLCAEYEAIIGRAFCAASEPLIERAAERYSEFVRYGDGDAKVLPAVMAVVESVRAKASVKDAVTLACNVSRSDPNVVLKKIRNHRKAAKRASTGMTAGAIEVVEFGENNESDASTNDDDDDNGDIEPEGRGEANIVEAFLWDNAWRQAFGNDLWELREFYTQMLTNATNAARASKGAGKGSSESFDLEMLNGGSGSSGSGSGGTGALPPSVGTQDEIRAYLAAIAEVITAVENKKLQRVLEIRESGRFLDRASKTIEDNLLQSNAAEERRNALLAEKEEVQARSKQIETAISELNNRLEKMREIVASELSKILNNREIIVKTQRN